MTLDPHFKAMLEEQARNAPPGGGPPMRQIPPEMIRAGYRAGRMGLNVKTAPADVETRDLEVGGGAGPRPARGLVP